MSGSVPSFCSSAFLARPPDEMGTRERYQRTLRIEFTTRCWQFYLAKAGPAWDVPLPWSAGLTQCSKRDWTLEKDAPLPWRAGRTVEENPRRTFWSSSGQGEACRTIAAAAPKQARAGHGDAARAPGASNSRRSTRAAVAQSAALRCTLSRRRDLSRANDIDRSCRLPVSPCQTKPTKSDLTPAFL